MPYKTLSNDEIKKQYELFLKKGSSKFDHIDSNYLTIRNACIKTYDLLKQKLENNKQYKSWKHQLDLEFGLFLYNFLNLQPDFNKKYESDYSFWKYLSVFVIPDIVADRWGSDKVDHFYKKPTAIYPFQVYWYIHLSWQGDVDKTYRVLENNMEDQILQLVDRASTIGINLDLYRCIMRKIAMIPANEKQNAFRAVMLSNTSKLLSTRPELYNNIEEYVETLFKGIKVGGTPQ